MNTHNAAPDEALDDDGDGMTPGERLIEAMHEIIAIERGEKEPLREHLYSGPIMTEVREHGETVWRLVDVEIDADEVAFSDLRKALRQSQQGMAALLGVPLATVRNWDQGRRAPRGPASRLLQVAARHPGALLDLPPARLAA